jgi:hypothetical protein
MKKWMMLVSCLLLSACSSETPKKISSVKQDKKPGIDMVSQDCDDPNIKGDILANGTKKYYVPGAKNYNKIEAEEYFCGEKYAQEAGYQKANK